jgi:hypothetical protein
MVSISKQKILVVLFVCLLGFVMFWRFKVSQTRFFDIDEFTHMNWAASIARGEKPYIDFFTFFTPGFHWVYSVLYKFGPPRASVFLEARYLSYLIVIGNTVLVGALFGLLRNKVFAVLAMILFAWLPMPYDKLFEIRPDNLSLLCCLLAFVLQAYIATKKPQKTNILYAIVGVSYALSMIVLVKMVPFVAFGLLFLLIDPDLVNWFMKMIKTRKFDARTLFTTSFVALVSFGIVCLLFLFWLLILGNFGLVWYSLTKLAFEANSAFTYYIMEPHLFFFPNTAFYGAPGISLSLFLNHTIWVMGIVIGAIRLFTPFVSSNGDRRRGYVELMIALTFFAFCFLYVQFYVLKHIQYLIPVSVFIAFYAADGFFLLYKRCASWLKGIPILLFFCVLGYGLVITTRETNTPKLWGSNTIQLQQMNTLLKMIPQDAEVFDIEGRLVFWKPSYYICCLPFMTYVHNLSLEVEPLIDVLERKKTPVIYQGDTGRLPYFTPEELAYINTHYGRVEGFGDTLWLRKESLQ